MKNKFLKTLGIVALVLGMNSCGVNVGEKIVINREAASEKYGKVLLGRQSLSQFQKEPFKTWYDIEHDNYEPNQENIKGILKTKSYRKYKIKVFMATWDEASQQQFPRIIKTLEKLKYPLFSVEIIALSTRKDSPNSEEITYHVNTLPTVVLENYGKEAGRIQGLSDENTFEKSLENLLKDLKNSKK